jgi:hypothetical protein
MHTSPYQQIIFLATDSARPKCHPSPEQRALPVGIRAITQAYADKAQYCLRINQVDLSATKEVPLGANANKL